MNQLDIIQNKLLASKGEPFIIVEAGINHNGKIHKAFDMIKLAKQVGADAVKFQTYKADEFVGDPAMTYTYMSQGQMVTESMLEMFKRCEFNPDEWKAIKQCCDKENITFLSTPQNYSDLKLLLDLGIPAIKVGSDDFNNLPLLRSYAETKLPLILSCGMADMAEVYQALEAVGALDGYPVVLLLCTSQYPTPPEDVNMLKLKTLGSAFPMVKLGLSDHTQGAIASVMAVPLGAMVFEKHFTLDHDLPGPDHWFSENPQGLKVWVESIRTAYKMLGSGILRPTEKERAMRYLARRSVVALKEINQGDVFSLNNIGLRRSNPGLSPAMITDILGRKASRQILNGQTIEYGDFI